ncbi:MAG: hypothetical protein HY554_12900 [Elusimicrobia bacterium]|nr:hypothetical protein [Elusimicrobiota bacterium]
MSKTGISARLTALALLGAPWTGYGLSGGETARPAAQRLIAGAAQGRELAAASQAPSVGQVTDSFPIGWAHAPSGPDYAGPVGVLELAVRRPLQVRMNPEGTLVSVSDEDAQGGPCGRVFDLRQGAPARGLLAGTCAPSRSAPVFDASGSRVALVRDGAVEVWNAASVQAPGAKPLFILPKGDYPQQVAFLPGGVLLTAEEEGYDGILRLWDDQTGAAKGAWPIGRRFQLASGALLATGAYGARVADARTGEVRHRYDLGKCRGRGGMLSASALSQDGRYLALGGDSKLCVFDLEQPGQEPRTLEVRGEVEGAGFAEEGRFFYVDGAGLHVMVRRRGGLAEVRLSEEVRRLTAGTNGLAVSADGLRVAVFRYRSYLASGGESGKAFLFSFPRPASAATEPGAGERPVRRSSAAPPPVPRAPAELASPETDGPEEAQAAPMARRRLFPALLHEDGVQEVLETPIVPAPGPGLAGARKGGAGAGPAGWLRALAQGLRSALGWGEPERAAPSITVAAQRLRLEGGERRDSELVETVSTDRWLLIRFKSSGKHVLIRGLGDKSDVLRVPERLARDGGTLLNELNDGIHSTRIDLLDEEGRTVDEGEWSRELKVLFEPESMRLAVHDRQDDTSYDLASGDIVFDAWYFDRGDAADSGSVKARLSLGREAVLEGQRDDETVRYGNGVFSVKSISFPMPIPPEWLGHEVRLPFGGASRIGSGRRYLRRKTLLRDAPAFKELAVAERILYPRPAAGGEASEPEVVLQEVEARFASGVVLHRLWTPEKELVTIGGRPARAPLQVDVSDDCLKVSAGDEGVRVSQYICKDRVIVSSEEDGEWWRGVRYLIDRKGAVSVSRGRDAFVPAPEVKELPSGDLDVGSGVIVLPIKRRSIFAERGS